MEITKTILDFISSAFWPIITLIVFFNLREPISVFIMKIKNGSLKLPGGPEVTVTTQKNSEPQKIQTEEINKITSQTHNIDELQQIKDEKDKLTVIAFFEKTYRLIFNSQLNILLAASQLPSIPRDRILETFNTTTWSETYPFEQYINFLMASNLLQYDLSSNSYMITTTGRLFIQYLFENNIPIQKIPIDWKNLEK